MKKNVRISITLNIDTLVDTADVAAYYGLATVTPAYVKRYARDVICAPGGPFIPNDTPDVQVDQSEPAKVEIIGEAKILSEDLGIVGSWYSPRFILPSKK